MITRAEVVRRMKSALPAEFHPYVDASGPMIDAALRAKKSATKTVAENFRIMRKHSPRGEDSVVMLVADDAGVTASSRVRSLDGERQAGVLSMRLPGSPVGAPGKASWVPFDVIADVASKGERVMVGHPTVVTVGNRKLFTKDRGTSFLREENFTPSPTVGRGHTIPTDDEKSLAYLEETLVSDRKREMTVVRIVHPVCAMAPLPTPHASGWSTDGHRLHWAALSTAWFSAMHGRDDLSLDGAAVDIIRSMLRRGDVTVGHGDGSVSFANGGLTLTVPIETVVYPDICRVVKDSVAGRSVGFTIAEELRQAVKQGQLFSKDRIHLYRCHREGQNLCVVTDDPNMGSFSTFIDVDPISMASAEDGRFVRPEYVLDAIKGIKGQVEVRWSADEKLGPIVFYQDGRRRAAIVMPMRE